MQRIRLIYEQIQVAKEHLLKETVLDYRIALILLDNTAELIMNRELNNQFAIDEFYRPSWEPALTRWKNSPNRQKYSDEEKRKAQNEFKYKTRILSHRLNRISREDRIVLDVCHNFRSEAFHHEVLRQNLLSHIVRVLLHTTLEISLKLPISSYSIPHREEDVEDIEFLKKYGFSDPYAFSVPESCKIIVASIAQDIEVNISGVVEVLSKDLLKRIDEVIGGLYYLNDSAQEEEIDRDLQFSQFWVDQGAQMQQANAGDAEMETAFQEWQNEGKAKYTFRIIDNWINQAKAIHKFDNIAKALEQYWGIEKAFAPFEDYVMEEVAHYDVYLNSQM